MATETPLVPPTATLVDYFPVYEAIINQTQDLADIHHLGTTCTDFTSLAQKRYQAIKRAQRVTVNCFPGMDMDPETDDHCSFLVPPELFRGLQYCPSSILGDGETNSPQPGETLNLPQIPSAEVWLVLQQYLEILGTPGYWEEHLSRKDADSSRILEFLPVEEAWLTTLDHQTIFKTLELANFLYIKPLMEILSCRVAKLLQCKSINEIRHILGGLGSD